MIDEKIHDVYKYFQGDEIRWHRFSEVGLDEPYYDWYYAESQLYVIRDGRTSGGFFFTKAGSPAMALQCYKDELNNAFFIDGSE